MEGDGATRIVDFERSLLSIPHDIEGLLIHEMGPYHSILPSTSKRPVRFRVDNSLSSAHVIICSTSISSLRLEIKFQMTLNFLACMHSRRR
jgi:hypothetical protein